ncbi:methionine ABC transporter ATP-binding protein [Candidatus Enterococcus murrayae]|uniref:ATP-binding cassette domain-containing protein n=1 Tax=Candidatus Enterococcus murrayae TaxID=2815321 RepID=A0ABS3HI80_9ENTE|nr:ATP-binding cassette domain-containing protein [Enterococcus sp. MJM16]MBO0453162.1 ATP-binding cassette domain-containing protein [Enterococcus sp. MJM16]
MIELKEVSKVYQQKKRRVEAVKEVNLTIEKGEIFGVVGYSGAGKSTLIRMINFLEPPTTGDILINGQNLRELNKKELLLTRRKIGMIFQGYNLLSTATVYENIAKPLKLEGVSKDVIEERVARYLNLVGLTDRKDNYPAQLSGGQRQRVAIARALAHEPEILLSDEATSALDPETTESILTLLTKINQELGITIFLITHEIDVVQRICDRVAVMEDGRIVEAGPVIDLFTRPKEETTKRFIGANDGYNVPEEVLAAYKGSGRLVQLQFIGEEATEPVLARVAKDFQLSPNILSGNIGYLKEKRHGQLLVQFDGGTETDFQLAKEYIRSQGVLIEEVV